MEASSGSNGWSIGVPMGLLPSHVKVSSGSKGWSSRTYRSACRLARTAVWVYYQPIMEAPSGSSRWSIGVPMRLLPFHVKVSSDSNGWSSYTDRPAVWPERPYGSIASPYGDFQRRQRMVKRSGQNGRMGLLPAHNYGDFQRQQRMV